VQSYAVATFDLNLLPIHRVNGQESAELPGLMAVAPPRKTGRGREQDTLILYLMLSGNATLSSFELHDLLKNTANTFHQTPGSLTSAMRRAAEKINTALLERNRSTLGRGLQAFGTLVLAAIRNEQCTLLLSGPAHAVWVSDGNSRHVHDPALSGKGLGSGESIQSYFSQVELHDRDLLTLCGKFPRDWEADLLNERPPASLDASYRRLTMAQGDLNAVLIQAHNGHGTLTIMRPESGTARPAQTSPEPAVSPQGTPIAENTTAAQSTAPQDFEPIPEAPPPVTEEEIDALADLAAHMIQPSAYAIPPQPESAIPTHQPGTPASSRNFPTSIPRSNPAEPAPATNPAPPPPDLDVEEEPEVLEQPIVVESRAAQRRARSDAHAQATRQMAKVMVGGIRGIRGVTERLGMLGGRFIPRLLPGVSTEQSQGSSAPTYLMVFIAVVIPVLVVTIASVVYLRFGQSAQYDELYLEALNQRALATASTDPALQRDAWQSVLTRLDKAEAYRQTSDSQALRKEAQAAYDQLMGVVRLEFIPAFATGISGTKSISRMAASESELYMLDAEKGSIQHASFNGRSLTYDSTFDCKPGVHGGYQVGPLVDILALPKVNALGATVLGIDATGTLLYCAPGQVPHAIPLPPLPNTSWGDLTAFALDGESLYVLDSASRAIWVFVGKDSSFTDTPYFYFGNEIPPSIDSAIDMTVSGDDLYMLHSDGHISTCTFSRIAETPTRCQDPAPLVDNNPAHSGMDIFSQGHFTQITLTNPPNPVVLLLDAEDQSVYRLSAHTLEYQNQVTGYAGEASPFAAGPAGAMAVSPNYILYLSIGNQVYFATNLP
jgi:hypothetical protein